MKILVFAPHADDETLSCGGYILKSVSSGDEVKIVLVTSNGTGPKQGLGKDEDLASVRDKEFAKAAELLGVKDYELYDYSNNFFETDKTAAIKRIVATIKNFKPELILCTSPCDIHRIHRDTALAVKEALYHCETGAYESHSNGALPKMQLFYYESPKADLQVQGSHVADISGYYEKKMAIFKEAYKTQDVKEFSGWAKIRAEYWGYKADAKYGEAFMPDGVANILIK